MRARVQPRAEAGVNQLVKTVFAFVVGAGALAGIQHAYIGWVADYLQSDAARVSALPEMKPAYSFDQSKITVVLPKYPRIDTRAAERAGVMSAQRQVDMQVRAAQNAVPLPRR
jgi:hypothetical protein